MLTMLLPTFRSFLSGYGLIALAALDDSIIFVLPGSSDIAVIILVARQHQLLWLYPLLANVGAFIGSWVTYKIGLAIGEKGLEHWVSAKKLAPLEQRIRNKGSIALAVPGLLPPPFPMTAFILVCGALKVRFSTLMLAVAASKLIRYSALASLAFLYGRHVVSWLDRPIFKTVGYALFFVSIVGIAYSIYSVIKTARKH